MPRQARATAADLAADTIDYTHIERVATLLELTDTQATPEDRSPALVPTTRGSQVAAGGSAAIDTLNPLLRVPVLAAGALTGFAVTAMLAPDVSLGADAELVNVLRAMALIKGVMLVAMLAALLLRFRSPLPLRSAGMYLLGTALAVGACTAIFKLAFIGFSSFAFYTGLVLLGFGALREERLSRPSKRSQ